MAERCRWSYIMVAQVFLPPAIQPAIVKDGRLPLNGAPAGTSSELKAVWVRAAQFMLASSFDPFLFYQLHLRDGRLRPPNSLLTQKAADEFQHSGLAAEQRAAQHLKFELTAAKTALLRSQSYWPHATIHDLWRAVLEDSMVQISPLFRFCGAAVIGLPDVMARWSEPALDQYLVFTSAYDRHWQAIIPPTLKHDAIRIRQIAVEAARLDQR